MPDNVRAAANTFSGEAPTTSDTLQLLAMESHKCTECKATKPLEDFGKRKFDAPGGKKNERTAICSACKARAAARQRERRKRKRAESTADGDGIAGDGDEHGNGGPEAEPMSDGAAAIALEDLLVKLRDADVEPFYLKDWKVNVASESPQGRTSASRANRVAESIGEAMLLRWK